LDDNVQWLKNHARDRFYIDGYASSRHELIYNLALSQRRADWVKQALISKGIPENRIVLAVGWGSCIRFAPKEATNAGLRTGSSAFPTLQIEIDSPD
jgi:outer membrane protein OmpA-like peptidoglycan-associated protein